MPDNDIFRCRGCVAVGEVCGRFVLDQAGIVAVGCGVGEEGEPPDPG